MVYCLRKWFLGLFSRPRENSKFNLGRPYAGTMHGLARWSADAQNSGLTCFQGRSQSRLWAEGTCPRPQFSLFGSTPIFLFNASAGSCGFERQLESVGEHRVCKLVTFVSLGGVVRTEVDCHRLPFWAFSTPFAPISNCWILLVFSGCFRCQTGGVCIVSRVRPTRRWLHFRRQVARASQPLYLVFHLSCLASAKREDEPSLGLQAKGRRRGCDRSTLGPLSPKPSQIQPRFCVPNSNRCQSNASNASARIRKNESEHNRNYE